MLCSGTSATTDLARSMRSLTTPPLSTIALAAPSNEFEAVTINEANGDAALGEAGRRTARATKASASAEILRPPAVMAVFMPPPRFPPGTPGTTRR